jgi:DNA repair exonuclease SbcCD nuclease subunit
MDDTRHGLRVLESVLRTARSVEADLLLLAGDVFDHARVPDALVEDAASTLAHAGLRTVVLPGNHDALLPHSVYHRGGFADLDTVHVLGLASGTPSDTVRFADLDLEVWGRPHLDYFDMVPLLDPPRRTSQWQIAMAHGHWVTGPHDEHRAYRFHDHEVAALNADYLALGHWDRWVEVAPGGGSAVAAYYSGSPLLARTANLVTLSAIEGARIERVPILDAPD